MPGQDKGKEGMQTNLLSGEDKYELDEVELNTPVDVGGVNYDAMREEAPKVDQKQQSQAVVQPKVSVVSRVTNYLGSLWPTSKRSSSPGSTASTDSLDTSLLGEDEKDDDKDNKGGGGYTPPEMK